MNKLLDVIRQQRRQAVGAQIWLAYCRGGCARLGGGGPCAGRRKENLTHAHVGNRLIVLMPSMKFETFTRNVLAAAQEAGETFVVIHRAPDEFGLMTVQRLAPDLRSVQTVWQATVEPKPRNIKL